MAPPRCGFQAGAVSFSVVPVMPVMPVVPVVSVVPVVPVAYDMKPSLLDRS
ncbi:hypothetical protein AB0A69_03175 [Streptomyces sp. NPDC045431]|uniref:hypothetical protein n=1 Tax=Streptomyces sp. NPDC045431 TaxID=3155613 RepID=UPI0033E9850C